MLNDLQQNSAIISVRHGADRLLHEDPLVGDPDGAAYSHIRNHLGGDPWDCDSADESAFTLTGMSSPLPRMAHVCMHDRAFYSDYPIDLLNGFPTFRRVVSDVYDRLSIDFLYTIRNLSTDEITRVYTINSFGRVSYASVQRGLISFTCKPFVAIESFGDVVVKSEMDVSILIKDRQIISEAFVLLSYDISKLIGVFGLSDSIRDILSLSESDWESVKYTVKLWYKNHEGE